MRIQKFAYRIFGVLGCRSVPPVVTIAELFNPLFITVYDKQFTASAACHLYRRDAYDKRYTRRRD
jgi:hypothetical protein